VSATDVSEYGDHCQYCAEFGDQCGESSDYVDTESGISAVFICRRPCGHDGQHIDCSPAPEKPVRRWGERSLEQFTEAEP